MEASSLDAPAVAYRTFSRRLPLALTLAAGALIALGGAGTWVRATTVATSGAAPQVVERVAGSALGGGQAMIALGLLAAASALGWRSRDGGGRAFPIVASLLAIGIGSWQLAEADSLAARMAEAARAEPGFAAYHAAFGWGAWLVMLGMVLLFLGLLTGVLREIDLRYPPPEGPA